MKKFGKCLLVFVLITSISAMLFAGIYANGNDIQPVVLASGWYHIAALKGDGTVVAWGDNAQNECNVPAGLNNVKAVSSEGYHTAALKGDGTVVAWGNNDNGQCNIPAGLANVIAVAAGGLHTAVLKEDGTIFVWGNNEYGQCNVPAGLSDVKAIASGGWHTAAVKADGTVAAWGYNNYGQCDVPADLNNVKSIAAGTYHTVALKTDGTVVAWGDNFFGECTVPPGLTNVKAVAAGYYHTVALKEDGTVAAWGWNGQGQCSVPAGLTNVTAVAAGSLHTVALKGDGTVVVWGNNDYGQYNVPASLNQQEGTPTPIPTPESTSLPVPGMIIPHITTDMQKYIQNEIVPIALKLTDTQLTDKTNSVTFDIDYDANTFELVNNDPDTAVVNGYIPFDTKLDLGAGANKRVSITYLNMQNDIALQEGSKVFTVNFIVKPNPPTGIKTFTLRPVNMLDSGGKVYNINDDNPVTKTVEVTNDAVIQGTAGIYLGDTGTGLNNTVLAGLNQSQINETLKNMKFTLKHDATDAGTVFNGFDVFIPDENGNLAVKGGDGKVTGKFRVYTPDTSNTKLTIDGVGYLAESMDVSLNLGTVCAVNTPVDLYPGDVGQIVARQLVLTPDGKINNIDFSAWLQMYKNNISGTANAEDKLRADFSKDGSIDNVDFSLWLAAFKKLLTMGT